MTPCGISKNPILPGSVVASVVTWNHQESIAACLDSVLNQGYSPLEVIVHDNASTDGTREILNRYSGNARVVINTENTGFCGAHNSAIRMSQSEFVLLVNPDVVMEKEYIQNAVHRMNKDARTGAVCGLLVQAPPLEIGCRVDGTGLSVSKARRFTLRDHGRDYATAILTIKEVFGCDGALPLYRRSMIDDISIANEFFDEMLFAHKEDHDVAWRSQLCGWKTVFDPSCVAIHPRQFKPGDLGVRQRLGREISARTIRNDLIVLIKNEDISNFVRHAPWIVFRRLAILVYLSIFERGSLGAYGFVVRNLRQILQNRKAIQEKRKVSAREIRRAFTGEVSIL